MTMISGIFHNTLVHLIPFWIVPILIGLIPIKLAIKHIKLLLCQLSLKYFLACVANQAPILCNDLVFFIFIKTFQPWSVFNQGGLESLHGLQLWDTFVYFRALDSQEILVDSREWLTIFPLFEVKHGHSAFSRVTVPFQYRYNPLMTIWLIVICSNLSCPLHQVHSVALVSFLFLII